MSGTSRKRAAAPGSAREKGPAKKPRLAGDPAALDPVKTFVGDTLEGDGAVFAHGSLQMGSKRTRELPRATPHVVMPPREEQNARTLMPENLRPMIHLLQTTQAWTELPPLDVLRTLYSPVMFGMASRMRHEGAHLGAPPDVMAAVELVAGVPAESHALLASLATPPPSATADGSAASAAAAAVGADGRAGAIEPPAFLKTPSDKRKTSARPVHLVDADIGGLGAPMRQPTRQPLSASDAKVAFRDESGRHMLEYYNADPIPDTDLAYGLARPHDYPMMQRIERESLAAWKGRDQLHNDAAEALPRTAIEVVSKNYLQQYRQRPNPMYSERACCAGDACQVKRLARNEGRPLVGYNPKEFMTPSQQERWRARRGRGLPVSIELDGAPGLCYVCIHYSWSEKTLFGLAYKEAPVHPINTISVEVGVGGYARDVLLPERINGVKTCISGHVPYFDAAHLQFEPLPDGSSVLCEVNVDFHNSLSQTNTCLGVRKTRALAGVAHIASVRPLAPERAVKHLAQWRTLPDMWVQFLSTVPAAVLADRALVDAPEQAAARVPVVWLRQTLLTRSMLRYALVSRLAPTTGQALLDHFGVATPHALDVCLHALANGALCSFEDSVAFVAAHGPLVNRVFALLALPHSWAREAFATQFDGLPSAVAVAVADSSGSLLVWRSVLFRVLAAMLLVRVLRPWPVTASGADEARYAHYFVQTHLHVLTLGFTALARGSPLGGRGTGDAWWLHFDERHEARLAAAYPQATAVVCVEELPDMSPLLFAINDYYDMPGKKSPMSQLNALIHVIKKAQHSSCQRRGFDKIIAASMQNYRPVGTLLALILRVVLLGNVPGAIAPLPLAAMVRVHASFGLDAVPARLLAWVEAHPMLVLALLREHHFYLCESNVLVDRMRALTVNWSRFKALARQFAGQVRRFVAFETARGGLFGRLDWSPLEQRVAETSIGEVLSWHEKQKGHNVKLRKDTDVGLLIKKMRPEEKALTPEALRDAYAWMRSDNRLEFVHVCAWRAARERQTVRDAASGDVRSVCRTGYLKLLGMTEPSLTALRRWLHMSIEYSAPDDTVKKAIAHMVRTAPRDVVLLKTYLRLVEFYTDAVPFFLPEGQMRQTLVAARASLALPGHKATTPKLGFAYFCNGCLNWATPLVAASRELLCLPPTAVTSKKRRRRNHHHHTAETLAAAPAAPAAPKKKKKKQEPPRPWPATPCFLTDGRAGSMKKAYFNPMDTHLYCRRVDFANDVPNAMGGDEHIAHATKDISRPLFADINCNQPLTALDMVGVWKWVRERLYGLCVYCARLCEVHCVNMTNNGLSCGEHALVGEYPRFHRLWKHIKRPASAVTVPQRHMCVFCPAHHPAHWHTTEVDVYDAQYALFKIRLCEWHHHTLRTLIPRMRDAVTPPLAMKTLVAHIGAESFSSVL